MKKMSSSLIAQRRPQRFVVLFAALLIVLLLGACARDYQYHGTLYAQPQTAPAIPGVNWDNQPFDLAALRGKVVLIFFGYTYCPDVCPLTLAELATLYQQASEAAKDVAVVFVSTDPQRDTPARLAQYIAAFNPTFYAVHVPADQLEAVKAAYGVFAEENDVATPPPGNAYYVDHSGYIYVIDKGGDLRLTYGYSEPKEELLLDVLHLVADS
jgi:protein SCO1/2